MLANAHRRPDMSSTLPHHPAKSVPLPHAYDIQRKVSVDAGGCPRTETRKSAAVVDTRRRWRTSWSEPEKSRRTRREAHTAAPVGGVAWDTPQGCALPLDGVYLIYKMHERCSREVHCMSQYLVLILTVPVAL